MAPSPGAVPASQSCCIPLRPSTLLPDRAAGDSRGSRSLATGGCPSQAFWAQIAVVALAGDLNEIPKVTGHGDALRRAPGMLQGSTVPSEDTGAHLPPLSWQYISPAPNALCELSPHGETYMRLTGSIFPCLFLFFKASLKLSLPFPGFLPANANMYLFALLLPFALKHCLGICLLSEETTEALVGFMPAGGGAMGKPKPLTPNPFDGSLTPSILNQQ